MPGHVNREAHVKKTLLLGSMLAGALALAPSAMASPGGGICQLDGQASFTKGLALSSNPFGYSFKGTLSNCQSSPGQPAVSKGTVEAGEPVTIGGQLYQEPQPTGSGGCSSSTTSGIAIVNWSDGKTTVVSYSTSGAAAAVVLSGSVIPSVTVKGTDANGNPVSTTINTTQFAGYSSGGPLAFEPPDPTACNSAAGVTAAGIQGLLGLYSQS